MKTINSIQASGLKVVVLYERRDGKQELVTYPDMTHALETVLRQGIGRGFQVDFSLGFRLPSSYGHVTLVSPVRTGTDEPWHNANLPSLGGIFAETESTL